jgi:hypothetical protein
MRLNIASAKTASTANVSSTLRGTSSYRFRMQKVMYGTLLTRPRPHRKLKATSRLGPLSMT